MIKEIQPSWENNLKLMEFLSKYDMLFCQTIQQEVYLIDINDYSVKYIWKNSQLQNIYYH